MKKQLETFNVRTPRGDPDVRREEILAPGKLAMHADEKKPRFRLLTHLPSGWRIGPPRKITETRELAARLLERMPAGFWEERENYDEFADAYLACLNDRPVPEAPEAPAERREILGETALESFAGILQILVDHDRATSRTIERRNLDFYRAWIGGDEGRRLFVKPAGTVPDRAGPVRVYDVVLELPAGTRTSLEHRHEDVIFLEREIHTSRPDHPVHRITCLTDLYDKCGREAAP